MTFVILLNTLLNVHFLKNENIYTSYFMIGNNIKVY